MSSIAAAKELRDVLGAGVIRRARDKLGGSHSTVTYPPVDALHAVSDPKEIEEGLSPVNDLNLYFHVAYCEFICPFCHYAKTYSPVNNGRDDVVDYLSALCREIDIRSDLIKGSEVSSVYIGGGTPTVLDSSRLHKLLSKIREVIGSAPKLFCVETSPITIAGIGGGQKLGVLLDAGVNRVSMGVQTFDDSLLQRYRGHRLSEMMRGLDLLMEAGIEINIDLIQDLPDQTESSLDADLAMIEKIKPHQVTWYLMRPSREAAWYKQIQRGSLTGLPTDLESAMRRYFIIRGMRSLGYTLRSGGRFVRDTEIIDTYKRVRNGLDSHLLGFGTSSYSHGWGWFFRNPTDHRIKSGIREYVDRMRASRSPIDFALKTGQAEKDCAARVTGIRDELSRRLLVGTSRNVYIARNVVDLLLDAKLVSMEPAGSVSLTDVGRVFEEEIASLFYSQKVIQTLAERDQFWVDQRTPGLASILGVEEGPVPALANLGA